MKEKLNEAQLDGVSGGVAVEEYDEADILDEYDDVGESRKPEQSQSAKEQNNTKAPIFRAGKALKKALK